ncbi:MAG: hypothetical protein AB8G15_08390 [Saprospiraceae bacterium]
MKKIAFFLLFICPVILLGQGTGIPLGSQSYHILDRLEIKSKLYTPFSSSIKYYARGEALRFALMVDTADLDLTRLDYHDLDYLFQDNNQWLRKYESEIPLKVDSETPRSEKVYTDSTQTFYTIQERTLAEEYKNNSRFRNSRKPLLKYFYKTPANLFELDGEHFYLKINPILNFKIAKQSEEDEFIFLNQRGVELRGAIDNKVYFYTHILESQARFPDYARELVKRDKAVPGAGFFKPYESSIFNVKEGYDYLTAQGYVGFNVTKHINVQLGHGQNFLGNGYRSLFLSDFATNYFYLKLNTQIGKVHYQNIFAELSVISAREEKGDLLLPKKYMAAHYLNYKPFHNLSIGIYEAIIFSRNNNFELQYLNPIILYKTVEGALGSPDNALIGLDVKWNIFQRFSLYGQLMLDEFKFDELFLNRNNWWANKYGIQLGLKYIDVLGVDHLDGQFEYNMVRPYTYTHRDSSASYSHFNQALAHPLGANFKEFIFKLRYQPLKKLVIDTRLLFMETGEDGDTTNWGSNILLSHTTREQDFGNVTGQGIGTKIMIAGIDVSYQLFHNIFIDFHYFYRKKDSALATRDQTTNYFGGGVRMNIINRPLDY